MLQRDERYYASVVYACLASLGMPLTTEDPSNKGRADMTITFSDRIYVIESKVDQPSHAQEQIRLKGDHEKYLGEGRAVYLIGISFDSKEKNITDFEWERAENRA